jgi:Nif-specific regulatory protein
MSTHKEQSMKHLDSTQYQLKVILKLSADLYQSENVDDLLGQLLSALIPLFDAEGASIALHDASTDELVFFLQRGSTQGKTFRIPISRGIAGYVARTGLPQKTNDVLQHPQFYSQIDDERDQSTQSMICAPLKGSEGILGTIQVLNNQTSKGFSSDDLEVLVAFGQLSAFALQRTRQYQTLKQQNTLIQQDYSSRYHLIEGQNSGMRSTLEMLKHLALTPTPFLFSGESGVGKELFARHAHQLSNRAHETFVVIQCVSDSEETLENDLFGFWDQQTDTFHKGKLEQAHRGTLYFDELGSLPNSTQDKLHQFLQTRTLPHQTTPLPLDIRFMASTLFDFGELIQNHGFRGDLFYEFRFFQVMLSPLRERLEDLPQLAYYFIHKSQRLLKMKSFEIPSSIYTLLKSYTWPGNIRELANVCERAVVLSKGSSLSDEVFRFQLDPSVSYPSYSSPKGSNRVDPTPPQHLLQASQPIHSSQSAISYLNLELAPFPTLKEAMIDLKRKLALEALNRCESHQGQAAQLLGMQSSNFSTLLKQVGLRATQRDRLNERS